MKKIDTFKNKNDRMVKDLFEKNDTVCLTETLKDKFDSEILSWDYPFPEYSKNANRQYKYVRSS